MIDPLPGGSWRRASRNAFVRGNTLHAELRDNMGFWNSAKVTFRRGDRFSNEDGAFVFRGRNRVPRGPRGPRVVLSSYKYRRAF